MPLTLIRGTFRIVGASPDGDSVRFYPEDPNAFPAAGLRVQANAAGGVQLRLDGIDALETHYTPRSSPTRWYQPTELAAAAADRLLTELGFRRVDRGDGGTVTAAAPEQTPGHILTRFADKYGRPVAFVYPGVRRGRGGDLAPVFLDVPSLHRSVNWALLAAGLVYPTFYSKLYVDLRVAMAEVAAAARQAGSGVWANDVTLTGFTLRSRSQLQNDLVILPKLFRRLADYLTLGPTGVVDLAGFTRFLAARDDRLFTIPDGHATGLDTLIKTRRQSIQLTRTPEDIVFIEA